MFLFLLFLASPSIFPFRYSLFLFLKCLLVSRLILIVFRLSPFISLGSCNHYSLACFLRSNNFERPSSNHGLCFFSSYSPRHSLAEIFIFSLIVSQALLISNSVPMYYINNINNNIINYFYNGRGGPNGCETSRLPLFLDSRLTDGGEIVSLTRQPPCTPRNICIFLLVSRSHTRTAYR
jgi:hypothetical protein